MKTWQRAQQAVKCGSCGVWVQGGSPVLAIGLSGLSRHLLRCRVCAGEPVDEASIAEPERAPADTRPEPGGFQRVGDLAPARFDAKMAAAGRDDQ